MIILQINYKTQFSSNLILKDKIKKTIKNKQKYNSGQPRLTCHQTRDLDHETGIAP